MFRLLVHLLRKRWAIPFVVVLSVCILVMGPTMALAAGFRVPVNSGDSLWYLSLKYGVSVEEIRAANNLWDYTIYSGDTLWIPSQQASRGSYSSTRYNNAPVTGTGQEDIYLLAQIIRAEAEGEPYVGQVAVGAVVLNRVRSSIFPNTIAGVIFEQDQFEPVLNGTIYQPPSATSMRAALDAINGYDPTGGALYFFNPSIAYSAYLYGKQHLTTIGKHMFLK